MSVHANLFFVMVVVVVTQHEIELLTSIQALTPERVVEIYEENMPFLKAVMDGKARIDMSVQH